MKIGIGVGVGVGVGVAIGVLVLVFWCWYFGVGVLVLVCVCVSVCSSFGLKLVGFWLKAGWRRNGARRPRTLHAAHPRPSLSPLPPPPFEGPQERGSNDSSKVPRLFCFCLKGA